MGIKVLVVDDSMMVRQLVRRTLLQEGYDVLEARDGLEALQLVRDNQDVGLIVCDVSMPRMNGLEFLEALRQDPAVAHAAVIVLTTEGQAERIARAKALGVKGWLAKPFQPDTFLTAVRALTVDPARSRPT